MTDSRASGRKLQTEADSAREFLGAAVARPVFKLSATQGTSSGDLAACMAAKSASASALVGLSGPFIVRPHRDRKRHAEHTTTGLDIPTP